MLTYPEKNRDLKFGQRLHLHLYFLYMSRKALACLRDTPEHSLLADAISTKIARAGTR